MCRPAAPLSDAVARGAAQEHSLSSVHFAAWAGNGRVLGQLVGSKGFSPNEPDADGGSGLAAAMGLAVLHSSPSAGCAGGCAWPRPIRAATATRHVLSRAARPRPQAGRRSTSLRLRARRRPWRRCSRWALSLTCSPTMDVRQPCWRVRPCAGRWPIPGASPPHKLALLQPSTQANTYASFLRCTPTACCPSAGPHRPRSLIPPGRRRRRRCVRVPPPAGGRPLAAAARRRSRAALAAAPRRPPGGQGRARPLAAHAGGRSRQLVRCGMAACQRCGTARARPALPMPCRNVLGQGRLRGKLVPPLPLQAFEPV
jgi:hypothetical protein